MISLAKELNSRLDSGVVGRLLSELGRKMYFPKGIVAQSAEAKQKAHRLNATIGMAYKNRKAFALPLLKEMLPTLDEAESVAYAPTAGVPALRKAWKALQIERNPSLKDVSYTEPVVVAGLTSGIFQMAELFVNPGDRILIPDMFWGNYRLIVSERREGIIDNFKFFNENGTFNSEDFKSQLSKSAEASKSGGKRGKVIILLNFPNNPTGYSPTVAEAEEICQAIEDVASQDCDILTVHDDAYFGLFYEDDINKESLFSRCAVLHENVLALKIDGATKEEYVWGFRVGFMSFASKGMSEEDFAPLVQKLMGSIRGTVSNCPGESQQLLLKMFNHPDYRQQKAEAEIDLKKRYEIVRSILEKTYAGAQGENIRSIMTPLPFNSGYFMAFQIHTISAEELRLELLEKGLGSIAIGEKYLRIAFAAIDQQDLEELYNDVFATAQELAAR